MKNRRVGTFTMGLSLLALGTVYLISSLWPHAIDPVWIMRLWPVVFISLGIEVLCSWALNKEDVLRYDGWAIFLIFCLIILAGGLATGQFVINNFVDYYDGSMHY